MRYSGHPHSWDQEYPLGREDRRGPDSDDAYGPREIGPDGLREHHYYRGHTDRPPLPRHFDEPQERDPDNSKGSTERPPFRPPPLPTSQPSSHGLKELDTEEQVDEGRAKSSNFRFGTTMPTTIDLQSAIESCDALCKFALHYSTQAPPSGVQELGRDGVLDPSERANLHMIRSMNTTMLIGLQNLSRSDKSAEDEPSSEPYHGSQRPPQPIMEEHERIHFGPGPPANEMVHELAKAATSIFQLAIRIKAWVGMTPAERELDEEINIIRGKRCLLMDKSLAVPTVDQHGNLHKDWAVVPGANSNSKSFYERQRDLEQQRKMAQQPRFPPPHQTHQIHQTNPHHAKHDHPSHGVTDTERSEAEDYRRYDSGFSSSSNSMSMDRSGGSYALSESNLTNRSVSGITQGLQNSNINHQNSSRRSSGSITGSIIGNGVKKSPENTPHQKYRKRAKRTQPPGRCLSCDSSDTPEWRRGPDGARTLCNACGLHYAKLLKRQNEQKQPPVIANTRMEDAPRGEQLQIISFPLRRQQRSTSSESAAGGGSHMDHTSQQDSGALTVRRPSQQSSVSSNISPMMSKREPFPRQETAQDGDILMA
ncbi:hypothetical protein BG003_006764 [Podila horticola]|nr:hypothetical protein BG003_006764 [Podila horticola]